MKYLSKEKVNTGRQPEIDIAKGICIFLMIVIHTLQTCAPDNEGVLRTIIEDFGGLMGFGVFPVSTGIGMRYSRHQDPKSFARRGIALLTISQLVNLLRIAIPGLVAFTISGDRVFLPYILEVIQSDVLTFFGLAFLLMALLKKLKLKDGWIFAIALVMNLLLTPLSFLINQPEAFWPKRILSLFILTDTAMFPLGTNFVLLAFGYLIGGIYPYIEDKDRLFNQAFLIIIPVSAIYIALRLNVPFPLMPKYILAEEPTAGLDALVLCLNTVVLLGIIYKICRLTGGKVPAFMAHLSKNINSYYCTSDVLIANSTVILLAVTGRFIQGQWMPYLFAMVVIALCYLCIELNTRYIHFTIAGLQGSKRAVVYTLIWIVSLMVAFYGLSKVTDPSDMISPFFR